MVDEYSPRIESIHERVRRAAELLSEGLLSREFSGAASGVSIDGVDFRGSYPSGEILISGWTGTGTRVTLSYDLFESEDESGPIPVEVIEGLPMFAEPERLASEILAEAVAAVSTFRPGTTSGPIHIDLQS